MLNFDEFSAAFYIDERVHAESANADFGLSRLTGIQSLQLSMQRSFHSGQPIAQGKSDLRPSDESAELLRSGAVFHAFDIAT
jgi:hypothetical protein